MSRPSHCPRCCPPDVEIWGRKYKGTAIHSRIPQNKTRRPHYDILMVSESTYICPQVGFARGFSPPRHRLSGWTASRCPNTTVNPSHLCHQHISFSTFSARFFYEDVQRQNARAKQAHHDASANSMQLGSDLDQAQAILPYFALFLPYFPQFTPYFGADLDQAQAKINELQGEISIHS